MLFIPSRVHFTGPDYANTRPSVPMAVAVFTLIRKMRFDRGLVRVTYPAQGPLARIRYLLHPLSKRSSAAVSLHVTARVIFIMVAVAQAAW
jgi:hypothetical protein